MCIDSSRKKLKLFWFTRSVNTSNCHVHESVFSISHSPHLFILCAFLCFERRLSDLITFECVCAVVRTCRYALLSWRTSTAFESQRQFILHSHKYWGITTPLYCIRRNFGTIEIY